MFIDKLKGGKVPLVSAVLAMAIVVSAFAFSVHAQSRLATREEVALRIIDYLTGEQSQPQNVEVPPQPSFGAVGSLRAEDYIPVVMYNDGYYSEKPLSVNASTTLDTTTLVVNPNENRVGIGTASPQTALDVSGAFRGSSTFDLTTSTPTTTIGAFIRTRPTDKATTTLSIGENSGDDVKGCIELVRGDGTYARAIIDGTAWNIAAGRCRE